MKIKSSKHYIKKRSINFRNFDLINFESKKEKNEKKINLNSAKNLLKNSFSNHDIKLTKGQIPLFSKNKNIILIIENKYDNKYQKGKSPFFISDKINIREIFKIPKMNNNFHPQHLGLCDYYAKSKENYITRENENDKDCDDSKTPRFNKD